MGALENAAEAALADATVGVIDTNRLEVKEPREGWKGRFFHSQNMTFAYYTVEAGAWIHDHSHPNDEVWNVIDGQLEITIAGEARVAGPGCAAVVPPNNGPLGEGAEQRASYRRRLPAARLHRWRQPVTHHLPRVDLRDLVVFGHVNREPVPVSSQAYLVA